jgi:uncharacterized protein YpuA (DUF1002 family)
MNLWKSMKMAVAALVLGAVAALAGTPVQKIVDVALGSATYTNSSSYLTVQPTLQVSAVELFKTDPASTTTTVRRVSQGLTNLVASIVGASSYGGLTNTSFYLFDGDELRVSGAGTNTGSLRITGQVLP